MMDTFFHGTDKKTPLHQHLQPYLQFCDITGEKTKQYREESFGFCVQLYVSANQVTVHLPGVDAQNHAWVIAYKNIETKGKH